MDIQIVTGFMGTGKTTFLNQYLPVLEGKTAVIENESGEVKLDGELFPSDIPVKEITAGCICCSVALDFRKGIKECAELYQPEHIVIEPSGTGKLSDIIGICERLRDREAIEFRISKLITLVDASSYEDDIEGFGDFYTDQIEHAGLILLTHLDEIGEEQKQKIVEDLRKYNEKAVICERDFRSMNREELQEELAQAEDFEKELEKKITRKNWWVEYVPSALRK